MAHVDEAARTDEPDESPLTAAFRTAEAEQQDPGSDAGPDDARLYRSDVPASPMTPIEADTTELPPPADAEEQRAADRAARRAAREQALGTVPRTPDEAAPEPVVPRLNTDRFAGSTGLFGLRLVTAGILGLHGVQGLLDRPAMEAIFNNTYIPEPAIMALVTSIAEVAIAVALVFGLLVRAAGFGVLLIAVGALVFVQWGAVNPIVPGQFGFNGELELLLAAVGLLFVFVGGGGLGLDRSYRKSRARKKAGY